MLPRIHMSQEPSKPLRVKSNDRIGFYPPPPPFRRLRGFSIDPSLATQLETKPISEIVFQIPWEDLKSGPFGEYLEVIDFDPASGCVYEPVDLDKPSLLAQDGLPPSEGLPQFHQQMVYAVAYLTIQNFEHALGRRTFWRPGPSLKSGSPKNDSHFVPRLRIYPHALREQNAYYNPARVALLFGYFKASGDDPAGHLAGSMVFTCLSHDIIAHEVTHALLDGMNREFLKATNRDVRAFHEAFADIVALFQHFTFPEILRHQIISTRGAIDSQENLLGQLAGQFGRTTGARGALRDAIGKITNGVWVRHEPNPHEYENTGNAHLRGAILVAAVFDAFLRIYRNRTADLVRLATGGTGMLQPGAIHPDLADRLASEAAKSARHVLTMCVRAIDYCPPVDITFGEFLRAVITADYEMVSDDRLNYRVAFLQAFRERGIYPRDVRTLSVESLRWRSPANEPHPPSDRLHKLLSGIKKYSAENIYTGSRRRAFRLERTMRWKLHDWLEKHFETDPDGVNDARYLGVNPESSFEVRSARIAYRTSPDGGMHPQLIFTILQDGTTPLDSRFPDGPSMELVGGCTVIADLRNERILYCISKPMSSTRLDRQRAFAMDSDGDPGATYFAPDDPGQAFAALHRNCSRS